MDILKTQEVIPEHAHIPCAKYPHTYFRDANVEDVLVRVDETK